MDINNKKVWQIAAGDTDRNFADLCLKWDVILNGPGSEGKWPECRMILEKDWGLSSKKLMDIQRFAEMIEDGDIVVLRIGTTDILGVGVVVGGYEWHDEFGDIDGWDLQHFRRVRWIWRYNGTPKVFAAYSLKFGDTTQLLDSEAVLDWIKSIPTNQDDLTRVIKQLPKPSHDATIDQIADNLFDKGVAGNAINSFTGSIDELIHIARWYQRSGIRPSESETVTYLVIPLLRALGWTPQKMAVEWNNVDIALFKTLPRDNANLSAVLEAKQKDRSCLNAKSQAQYYAEQPGRDSCSRLIVTDGIRYGIYFKKDGKFQYHPDAYLNITKMRDAYPVLNCLGAKDAFLFMSADWDS